MALNNTHSLTRIFINVLISLQYRANFHKGYPFLKGSACADCNAGQSCHNGLCSGAISGGNGTDTKTSVNSNCTDNHASCSSWSSRSECYNNPGYMLKNCRKSCNNCGNCYFMVNDDVYVFITQKKETGV